MILIPGDPFGGAPRPRQFICQACGRPGWTVARTPVHYHQTEAMPNGEMTPAEALAELEALP